MLDINGFNTKYKDYIEQGFYGLEIENQKVIDYLDTVMEGLVKIPDFRLLQAKLKFGRCRFYTNLHRVLNVLVSGQIKLSVENMINTILEQ